jgi:hypothetical protein
MGWVVSLTPRPRFTPGKGHRYPLDRTLGGPQDTRTEENSLASAGDRSAVMQSVVRHCTDWATPAPFEELIENHLKHINTLRGQNAEMLNVIAGGTHSYHCALRCCSVTWDAPSPEGVPAQWRKHVLSEAVACERETVKFNLISAVHSYNFIRQVNLLFSHTHWDTENKTCNI